MGNCVHCGGPAYGDGLVCFRCKGLGAKREIYDSEEGPHDPSSFSDLYLDASTTKRCGKRTSMATN